jgi:ankyrin repeat protein
LDNRTALHQAAWNNNLPTVKLLVERGANTSLVARDGQTALEYATTYQAKDPEMIRYLVAHTEYPLHHAICFNQIKSLYTLVNNYSVEIDPEVGF